MFGASVVYVFLCRASELWVFPNGLYHLDRCLTKRDTQSRNGRKVEPLISSEVGDGIEVTFRPSKSDQTRERAVVSRFRIVLGPKREWKGVEGFGTMISLLKRHSTLPE